MTLLAQLGRQIQRLSSVGLARGQLQIRERAFALAARARRVGGGERHLSARAHAHQIARQGALEQRQRLLGVIPLRETFGESERDQRPRAKLLLGAPQLAHRGVAADAGFERFGEQEHAQLGLRGLELTARTAQLADDRTRALGVHRTALDVLEAVRDDLRGRKQRRQPHSAFGSRRRRSVVAARLGGPRRFHQQRRAGLRRLFRRHR